MPQIIILFYKPLIVLVHIKSKLLANSIPILMSVTYGGFFTTLEQQVEKNSVLEQLLILLKEIDDGLSVC